MDGSYEEGRVAYLQHKPITANPYGPFTERSKFWSEGWHAELNTALDSCPLDTEE